MRIAIIGAGNMGAALAERLTRAGHEVTIANSRGPETLAGVAAKSGTTAAPIVGVASHADIVVISIPEGSIPKLPVGLFSDLPEGTVVIDTGNYVPIPRDGQIAAIDAGQPESQWVQSQLHHPVVKAFNTIRSASLSTLGKPAGSAGRIAVPVAGDDPTAKSVVLKLVDELGFDALDAGSLGESWRQQPGTPIWTSDLPLDAARQALKSASPQHAARWRNQTPGPHTVDASPLLPVVPPTVR
jgi:predicted dinucleotide-binding enzyme